MNRGFWEKLKKPIFVLAPMANVTDAAFRHMIAKYGKPDVFWTEFVSVDGLVSAGKDKLLVDFWYGEEEHPIVAQVFGAKPENFYKVGKMIRELGFDGMDINMGCPDRAVLKQGAGGSLIKNPKLALEIILAAKEGVGDLPVSIKTRIGFGKPVIDEWFGFLAGLELALITVHLRTVKELSLVPAHWDLMPEIVKIIDNKSLVLGNGDVKDLDEARQKVKESSADGVMIGRGIFGNPWLFANKQPSLHEKLRVMVEHTKLFEKKFVNIPIGAKSFEVMKKHYKAYVTGFDGAKELRMQLMEAKNSDEVKKIVEVFTKDAMIASAINR
ncbi:MAG: tRNA-dihydrouridine synthase [Candidatus Doudnabacteria bacterium]|nr:tRNA-dihydrouridine synthase [Candidatus Doudnabacteria bacterium]